MSATKTESVHNIERELTVLLHRVRRHTMENARSLHPELHPAAYSVFRFVADHEPTRACDVVEHLGVDKGAVSRQVTHLEMLGLVERRCDASDHRVQTIALTGDGRSRVEAVADQRRAEFERRLSNWSAENLEQFADRLSRYNASLDL